MPSPCSTNSTSGKEAPPWETRQAGPLKGLRSTGVWIVAVPITDSGLQAAGFDSKTAATQAFWIVDRREGSASGSVRSTLAMSAWPKPADVILTLKLAPSSLLACPAVEAVSTGVKGSAAQLETWKWEETGATVPPSPETCPVISIGEQLVGLNSKFGRSTSTWMRLSCSGIPFSCVGKGSETIVRAAVSGSM